MKTVIKYYSYGELTSFLTDELFKTKDISVCRSYDSFVINLSRNDKETLFKVIKSNSLTDILHDKKYCNVDLHHGNKELAIINAEEISKILNKEVKISSKHSYACYLNNIDLPMAIFNRLKDAKKYIKEMQLFIDNQNDDILNYTLKDLTNTLRTKHLEIKKELQDESTK